MSAIEIFKPGRHVATSGKSLEFSDADLKATAAAYNPALHEAPLVIGHPKIDAPAYGWVKRLAYAGGLEAEPTQVDPAFAEMVAAGRFKKISASFWEPGSPNNPQPGVYYLHHVGFLGATPPAVKGLRPVAFNEADEGVVEFSDWTPMQNASLWRRLREWLISKFTLEEADQIIPGYLVEDLEAAARGTQAAVAYSEQQQKTDMTTPAEIAAREAKLKTEQDALAAQQAQFAEREKRIRDAEEATRRAGIAEFVTGLVKDGKVLPRDEAALVAYMAGPNDAGVIEFAEGTEKKTAKPDQWLRGFLNALPKQIDYAERSRHEGAATHTVNFAAPPGYAVDPVRLELHNQALAYQRAHPDTQYSAAIAAVSH